MEKVIVDSNNKVLMSRKKKNLKLFKENIGRVVGGVTVGILIFNIIEFINIIQFSASCQEYYGVYWKYFRESELFKVRLVELLVMTIALLYPIFFVMFNKKNKSRIFCIISFFLTIFLMFYQNIIYASSFLKESNNHFVNKIEDNVYVIVAFAISDVIISFYVFIRKNFLNLRKIKIHTYEKIILGMALIIFLISVFEGIYSIINGGDIKNKQNYEMLGKNKVVVAEYKNQFVTMNCKVKNGVLHIKKYGEYELIEMKENIVHYSNFKDVKVHYKEK